MTKVFTARRILVLTGVLLVVATLSFSGKKGTETGRECTFLEEKNEGKELFWETLSRQFSGSASNY